jgi:predicted TPR repeat methyltransferase
MTAPPCPAPADTLGERLEAAIGLLRSSRLDEAEAALVAILKHWPGQSDAQHFLGVLRHNQGRSEEAAALIESVVAQQPDHAGAWNNLGNVRLGMDQVDAAVQAYERGIAAAEGRPETASPLSNLGTVYRKQGRVADAEAAYRRAVELVPEFAEGWYNLSLLLLQSDRVHEGLQANSRAIALWPHHLQGRDQVIRALVLLGEREQAARMYREWLAEEPDNPVVQHQLAACMGGASPERASDAYVQQVFDNFAESFDAKLESLDYRAPGLVVQALSAVVGPARGRLDIVDAGCGTGLCGPLLKPWARHLAGCDLSKGMLRRAVPRRAYDALHQAELVYYLGTQPSRFDVVVSADTLCYFGDLAAALAAAHRCLRPGGWLVFTVEALAQAAEAAGEPHRLLPSGRYAHGRAHIEATLTQAGLVLKSIDAEPLRLEAGIPVAGWLVTAGKP